MARRCSRARSSSPRRNSKLVARRRDALGRTAARLARVGVGRALRRRRRAGRVLQHQPLGRGRLQLQHRARDRSAATPQFTALAAGIGSKLTKMRIDALMPQPGARTRVARRHLRRRRPALRLQHAAEHTSAQHTISDLQFKSALTDSASLVWYGITRINPRRQRQRGEPDVAEPAAAASTPRPPRSPSSRSRPTTSRSAVTARRPAPSRRPSCSTWSRAASRRASRSTCSSKASSPTSSTASRMPRSASA